VTYFLSEEEDDEDLEELLLPELPLSLFELPLSLFDSDLEAGFASVLPALLPELPPRA
jgi:hypothetical protein